MNEKVWHKIFREYLSDYRAINKLEADHIATEEQITELRESLLKEIITTFESEVED